MPATDRDRALDSANARRRTPRYRSLLMHWLGRAFVRPARATAAALPPVEAGQVGISWAGHATLLIRYHDLAIACDPMLGSWCGAVHREVAPGLSPAELGEVDLVLISSGAPDHLHRQTLAKLPRSATVIVPPRCGRSLSDLGFARLVELGVGQSVQHRAVDVATTAVRSAPDRPALGYLLRGDGPSVFVCGESGYFSGFAEVGRRFQPDIALLPIGGYAPRSFRKHHMSPLDALTAFDDLRARVLIPIRYGSFALSYERLEDPRRWLEELVAERQLDAHVRLIAPGESRVFSQQGRKAAALPRAVTVDLDTPAPAADPATPPPADPSDSSPATRAADADPIAPAPRPDTADPIAPAPRADTADPIAPSPAPRRDTDPTIPVPRADSADPTTPPPRRDAAATIPVPRADSADPTTPPAGAADSEASTGDGGPEAGARGRPQGERSATPLEAALAAPLARAAEGK